MNSRRSLRGFKYEFRDLPTNMERLGSRSKKEQQLKDLLSKVNERTYCARRYVIQVKESHVSPMDLAMARALEDKRHRWSKEMKKYDRGLNRIEKRLDKVHEQNLQVQKKIKKIQEKPRDHADEIKLLLYLEEKKRPDEFVQLEYCPRVLRLAYDGYAVV